MCLTHLGVYARECYIVLAQLAKVLGLVLDDELHVIVGEWMLLILGFVEGGF